MADIPKDCLKTAQRIVDKHAFSKLSSTFWNPGPIQENIARALADEREACCKAICFQCARGDHPARQREDNGAWVHVGRGWIETCKAQAIRGRTDSLAPAPASAPEKAD